MPTHLSSDIAQHKYNMPLTGLIEPSEAQSKK
jgi:hypothetical protein